MNKRLLLLMSLVAFALAGCSKSGNDPAPSLTGTWTWAQGTRVTAPKNGQASTVAAQPRATSAVYTFDGKVGFTLVTGGNTQENGRYTHEGGALTLALVKSLVQKLNGQPHCLLESPFRYTSIS